MFHTFSPDNKFLQKKPRKRYLSVMLIPIFHNCFEMETPHFEIFKSTRPFLIGWSPFQNRDFVLARLSSHVSEAPFHPVGIPISNWGPINNHTKIVPNLKWELLLMNPHIEIGIPIWKWWFKSPFRNRDSSVTNQFWNNRHSNLVFRCWIPDLEQFQIKVPVSKWLYPSQ